MQRDSFECRTTALHRRRFLQLSVALAMTQTPQAGAQQQAGHHPRFDDAAEVLHAAAADGTLGGAAMLVWHRGKEQTWFFGQAPSADAIFLIASISKPMTAAALMTLCDAAAVRLDDPVCKYIPELKGEGREQIQLRHLLTHVSGLPDQLPENAELRARHAPLADFVTAALRTPLLFAPGTRYSYSSMGILLAAEVAQRVSGMPLQQLMAQNVFAPLQMQRSALGLGQWKPEQTMRGQLQHAAAESGGGDERSRSWDWNSLYWRSLGAPWGGVHSTAGDVARFFAEFLHPSGRLLSEQTARLMVSNHNAAGMPPRGLGFGLGQRVSSKACSPQTFGHGGSTGTLAWADPANDTICVVLTTLPGGAIAPHPRQLASDRVAEAVAAAR